jgi:site-specific DNA-methyltransferase (adenine-specific)
MAFLVDLLILHRPINPADKKHPTERPIPLIKEIMETFVGPGSKVLVPFLGSGNTLIAAHRNSCYGEGFELTQSYKEAFIVKVHEMLGGAK